MAIPSSTSASTSQTDIQKLFSKKFAESGSPAVDVLKKMTLTNDDQEAVAKAIAGDKEDPEKAGADWVAENERQGQVLAAVGTAPEGAPRVRGSRRDVPGIGCRA